MTEQKQPLLWVDVAAGVHALRPDVTFVMAGDGDLMSAVRRSVTWNRYVVSIYVYWGIIEYKFIGLMTLS
jgi:hypothetical protein